MVFVTGDIAFSGSSRPPNDEYQRSAKFLQSLATSISVPTSEIFVIPGNHDVQRSTDLADTTLLDSLRAGKIDLDKALTNRTFKELLTKRQSNYAKFAKDFAPLNNTPDQAEYAFWWSSTREFSQYKLRIIGLNTAILSNDDNDQGKLQVGEVMLSEVFRPASQDGEELVIVLSHHPVLETWLCPSDQENASRYVSSHSHIYMCGHVHEAESETRRSGAGKHFVQITAGAVHRERQHHSYPKTHSYNIACVYSDEQGKLRLHVWHRRWSDQNKEFKSHVDKLPEGQNFASHELSWRPSGIPDSSGSVTVAHPIPMPDEEGKKKSSRA